MLYLMFGLTIQATTGNHSAIKFQESGNLPGKTNFSFFSMTIRAWVRVCIANKTISHRSSFFRKCGQQHPQIALTKFGFSTKTKSMTDLEIDGEAAESVHTMLRTSADKDEEKREADILAEHALDVLQQLSGASELRLEDVEIRPLLGGATNKLFVASTVVSDEAHRAVLRVYGPGTEKLIDRKFEIRVLEMLGNLGIGAKLLKSWEDGRAEEFLHGHALRRPDLKRKDILEQVGKSLGILHRLSIDEEPEKGGVSPRSTRPWLLKVVHDWGNLARQAKNGVFADTVDRLLTDFDDLVQRTWKKYPSPLVLSHNDLNAGNILIKEDSEHNVEQFYVLDYEYSGYNFQMFDLANFYCESFMDNHQHKFPFFKAFPEDGLADADLRLLVRYYLSSNQNIDVDLVSEESIQKTVESVKAYSLGSHVLWGVWGLSQSEVTGVPFGFEEYGLTRIELFYKWKESNKW
jgi:thiamine kinase-like enzyme